MKERPILFNASMVRALLADMKTMTRRIAKPVKHPDLGNVYSPGALVLEHEPQHVIDRACPYGQPGDRLWVRETHYLHGIWSVRKDADAKRRWTFHATQDMGVQFEQPNGLIRGRSTTVPGWYRRPSIHMPRWASRITLKVASVRVERLQDISEADAIAEGVRNSLHLPGGRFARENFAHLWWTINGDGSWESNPWVWVIEFKRVEGGAP